MAGLDDQLKALPIVTEASETRLNVRQLEDYRSQRQQCFEWLLTRGKDTEQHDGYAFETVKARGYRMDRFYRFVWDQEDGYTAEVGPEHADDWMEHLIRQDRSNADKSSHRKATRMLMKWRHQAHGIDEWEPEISFPTVDAGPRDFLTIEERKRIREAALEYGSVPTYRNVTPEERDRWKAYLAQRFEKSKDEVTIADWKRANGWKIPSLVSVSLDTGLRPIEVKRSKTSWIDIQNAVLRIPKEESSKNVGNWVVGLRSRTAEILERWLDQRRGYADYDDSDAIWLTRHGNAYHSATLRSLLRRLCELADIPYEHRQMSWYSIRHSVGTYMTREEDLAAAQAQLRHKSPQTTMKYDQVPVEDRRAALDRMG